MTKKERDDAMAKTYKATFLYRTLNTMMIALLRAGVKMGNMTLLTVRGRKSGQPRTTPVMLTEQHGKRWLISSYGQVNWVQNLRVAGEATLTRGRQTEWIRATELSAREAAPLLKHTLTEAPSYLLPYFDVTPDSPLEDFEREVPRHPVFLLKSVSEQQDAGLYRPPSPAAKTQ
jgi:deazaflavin-dependent oxidoreductase (nitroreductase family)